MKRTVLLLLFAVSMIAARASGELLQFGTSNYEGWVYTQSIVELNNSNISQDNINLYWDYVLNSPEVTASGVKSIAVNVTGRTNGYQSGEYSNTLARVTLQLINDNDSVLMEKKHTFSTKERDRNFEVVFDVSDIAGTPFRLRLACWDANLESRLSVRKVLAVVKEYNLSGVEGDVNNDGVVTSADVTALYDLLLNGDTSHVINGDVTNDGVVTSADVTSVYSILLGGS